MARATSRSLVPEGAADRSTPPGDNRVTVVIPARNAAATLARQLAALDRQTFGRRFLVIVVDNGSDDGTGEVARGARPNHYDLLVVQEPKRGINSARNAGVGVAPDGAIVLCDADDEVGERWLAAMADAIGPGVWVGGALDYTALNTSRTCRLWDMPPLLVPRMTEPFVDDTRGCNCGFRRAMWSQLAGFDERISGRGGDEHEFFMRAHGAGYRPVYVPDAVVSYRLRPGLIAMMGQRFRQGRNQVQLTRLPGGRLLPFRYTLGGCLRASMRALAAGPRDLLSPQRRYLWIGAICRHAGRLLAVASEPNRGRE